MGADVCAWIRINNLFSVRSSLGGLFQVGIVEASLGNPRVVRNAGPRPRKNLDFLSRPHPCPDRRTVTSEPEQGLKR